MVFWHRLTREQDYAQTAMARNKIRRLDLLAGAPCLDQRIPISELSPTMNRYARGWR